MLANWVCTKCGIEKPVSEFAKDRTKKTGFRPSCKQCNRAWHKKYHKKNAGKRSKIAATRYKENKKHILSKNKEWRDQNKDWYKKRDSERSLEKKEYYEENKDLFIAHVAKRRAAKLQATPIWAKQGYISLFYKMAKMEEKRTGRKVHVDHIIPLQGEKVCGLHCEQNLQLLFAEDNLSKGAQYESAGGVSF